LELRTALNWHQSVRFDPKLVIFRSMSNTSDAAARRAATNREQLAAAQRAFARAQRPGTPPAVAEAAARTLKITQARNAIDSAAALLKEVSNDE
jgi:hypothetical protein